MADHQDAPPPENTHRTKPLSRRASKILVIASILFIIGATIGGSYYLVSVTSTALEMPADTTESVESPQTPSAAGDSTASQP